MTNTIDPAENHDINIRLANLGDLNVLEQMFIEMYQHFYRANGQTKLPDDGFARWSSGYERSAGKSRVVLIAAFGDELAGFIEGQIKLGGPLSGLGKIGHVAHLYTSPVFRRKNVGRNLYSELQAWFRTKSAQSETVEAAWGNYMADNFWEAVGFQPTFTSFSKPIDIE